MNALQTYGSLRMQRDNLLLAVSRSAAKLIRARRWRFVMDEVLGDVATAAHVDRAWLFRIHARSDGDLRTSAWHEWGAAGTGFVSLRNNPAFTDMPIRGPRHDHSLSMAEMLLGRVFVCSDTRSLPTLNRATADSLGIRSIIRAPVLRNGRLWGALGFDSVRSPRPWLDAEQEALTAMATLLSAVLERDAAVNVLWSTDSLPVSPALQAAATAAIASLHGAEQIEDGIAAALGLVAMALRAQRIWITENRYRADGGTNSAVAQEWRRPGLPPLGTTPAAVVDLSGTLRRWYDIVYAGKVLQVDRASAEATEQAALDAAGLEHMICVPVPGLTRRWHGGLCLSRPQQPELEAGELRVLEAVADAMHAARDRRLGLQ